MRRRRRRCRARRPSLRRRAAAPAATCEPTADSSAGGRPAQSPSLLKPGGRKEIAVDSNKAFDLNTIPRRRRVMCAHMAVLWKEKIQCGMAQDLSFFKQAKSS